VVRGKKHKAVLFGNRNAFYYVLDRNTGKFLAGKEFARQTWARGLDDSGRPIVLPNSEPSVEGAKVYPDLSGGTNWFSPSYSPQANLFYVAARDVGGVYLKRQCGIQAGRAIQRRRAKPHRRRGSDGRHPSPDSRNG